MWGGVLFSCDACCSMCRGTLKQHLTKFGELLEAAVDLERIPDEYLIGKQQYTVCL